MAFDLSSRYREHLTPSDLRLLARVAHPADPSGSAWIAPALGLKATHDEVFAASFDINGEIISPFLVFAVAVHQVAAQLDTTVVTSEWVAPKQHLPVFDTPLLRDFLASEARRLFLAELLMSYTRVAAWTQYTRTERGWRRNKFSDIDPVQLAQLAAAVSDAERPGVWRRLGDLALFLTGVFPDHTATRELSPINEARLRRMVGIPSHLRLEDLPGSVGQLGAVGLLEAVGERSYQYAVRGVRPPLTEPVRVIAEVAERFRIARRVLNLVTERYLFPHRAQYFNLN